MMGLHDLFWLLNNTSVSASGLKLGLGHHAERQLHSTYAGGIVQA